MKIVIAKTQADIDACLALRCAIFMDEQGYKEAEEFDALDATATHVLITIGATPVGAARLIIEGDTGKIGRVCVAKSHRSQGLGAQLIAFALDHFAKSPAIVTAYLSAQIRASAFYEGLGFTAQGAPYMDGHVEHIDMTRAL